ncbi:cache domain-containing sensor histidine kinase [Gorillibacterium timonense]|uniref:cache domain-containing sensor histidine kinase n=1 Tax=Gorillibacterium timonense TaxID=1689269 RepID=UPI00071D5D8C|nr:sensor histidine kinase [Gorillibacterium timonense]
MFTLSHTLHRLKTFLKELAQGLFAAKKWIIAYLLLIFLPSSVILFSFYQRSSDILEEEVTQSMQQTLKQASLNLTYKLEHIRDTSNSVFMNQTLYKNLMKQDQIVAQLDQLENLRNLADTAKANTDIYRLRFFVDPSRLYARDNINVFPFDTLDSYKWYPAVKEANGTIVWTGVYRQAYTDSGEQSVFSAVRLLRNPQQFDEQVGVLSVDVPESVLGSILDEMRFSARYSPFLLDADNRVVYRSSSLEENRSEKQSAKPAESGAVGEAGNAEQTKQTVDELPADALQTIRGMQEGIVPFGQDENRGYLIFSTVGTTNWKLVAPVTKAELSHRSASQGQAMGIVTIIGMTVLYLLLAFLLLMFTVQGMKKRVQTIIGTIRLEGVEWLEERRSLPPGDFRLLERSVDRLVRRVNGLMEESYKAKVHEREAQLKALQAQINPHFLYNALDMINWSAIAHDAEDTSQMIEALARYFRLSLNKGQDTVSIADELELAQVYLDIQQNRFPSTFTYEIEEGAGLEGYRIPKLTLQPLVENALLHGIRKSSERQGAIRIRAWLEEEEIRLAVSDDGMGMEPEFARRLLMEPRPEKRADGTGISYGLFNVNERIRFFCGEGYGLSIETGPGAGTTVSVRMKAISFFNEEAVARDQK